MSILISFIYNNYLTTYLSKFEVLIITWGNILIFETVSLLKTSFFNI